MISELKQSTTVVLDINRKKPAEALQILRHKLDTSAVKKSAWRGEARLASVLGSAPKSRPYFISGLRNWVQFIEITYGKELVPTKAFPPSIDDVLAWANIFSCIGTFGQYLTQLRNACHAMGYQPPPACHPAISKAFVAIQKRQFHESKPKYFVRRWILANLVGMVRTGQEQLSYAMLWLMAYSFLLRLPSEALQACKAEQDDVRYQSMQTLVWKDERGVCIRIKSRKNMPRGSGVIYRTCTCMTAKTDFSNATCPVHMLWDKFLVKLAPGSQPWKRVTPQMARDRLRRSLSILGIPEAENYGTHDLRRGHAEVSRLSLHFATIK